jgi:hypothetical protein
MTDNGGRMSLWEILTSRIDGFYVIPLGFAIGLGFTDLLLALSLKF